MAKIIILTIFKIIIDIFSSKYFMGEKYGDARPRFVESEFEKMCKNRLKRITF
ncbi:hypothetical protein [Chryseobacterium sp. MP_3.2]|uniref:hypothetical protein n=1 Tax=Chryseobacterium sp. MP_3.2 TaxID=3071712 RepID=UPI002DFA2F61|nr:hypothetical protein [Chryseobacterium sp. MP_3.2]